MRDPDRIPEVLKELKMFWEQSPDLRLGQIISNLSYDVMENSDPFYLEDDKLLTILIRYNRSYNKSREG